MSGIPDELAHLMEWLDSDDTPFTCYMGGYDDERIELHVPHTQVDAVIALIASHGLELADGTVIPVDVTGMAGESWISEPTAGSSWKPDSLHPDTLVGLDVREAARRANDAGWFVRAYEPEAVLTADMNTQRMDLCYSPDDVVVHASIG